MKNSTLKKIGVAVSAGCFGLAASVAQAVVPNAFTNGTAADAVEVNDNFNYLDGRIDTISLTPGPAGADGIDGTNGTDGAQGIQGIQGPQGNQGNQGPAGADGLDGAAGADGTNGTNGSDGADGQEAIENRTDSTHARCT